MLAGAPVAAQTLDLLGGTQTHTTLPFDFIENGTLKVIPLSDMVFAGILQDGLGTFTLDKSGLNSLTLTGANTYSGETRIVGGTLIAGANNTLSANSRIRIGGILELSGFDQVVRGFYNGGSITNTTGGSAVLTTNNAAGTTSSFAGSINQTSGNAIGLIKQGAGVQNLTGASNYSLGTEIQDGVLGFGDALALGIGVITFTGPGTLTAMAANIDLANNIHLDADGRVDSRGASPTLSGVISGANRLIKVGSGSLIISNSGNTYAGGTLLTQGNILLGGNDVLGTGTLTIAANGVLGTTGTSKSLSNKIQLDAQLSVFLPGAGEVLTLSGLVTGSGSLYIKGGDGMLALTHANDFTGTTYLTAGTLGVGGNDALGTGRLFISEATTVKTLSSAVLDNYIWLSAPATFDTSGGDLTLTHIVKDSTTGTTGTLIKAGSGTLSLGVANTYSGGTFINGGILSVAQDDRLGEAASALTFNGGTLQILGANFSSTARAITLVGDGGFDIADGAANLVLDQVITGGGKLTKSGLGFLTLDAANTFTGGITVNDGVLAATKGTSLGNNILTLNGGSFLADAANLSFGNAIVLGSGAIDDGGNFLTLSGVISGGAGDVLTKVGTGRLILNGVNTYSGGSLIADGAVFVGANNALGTGSAEFASDTSLTATASVSLANALVLDGHLVINDGGNDLVLLGAISGSGPLDKLGNGSVALFGANTYTGPTNLAGGTLIVGSNSALGNATSALAMTQGTVLKAGADITLANDITLGGTGATIDSVGFTLTLNGEIGGGAAAVLTKTGNGFLVLGTANTYGGGTSVAAGGIDYTDDLSFGVGTITANGGGLRAVGAHSLANKIVLASNMALDLGNAAQTLTGIISGGGQFSVVNGDLTLTVANTYSGGTVASFADISVENNAAFGTSGVTFGNFVSLINASGQSHKLTNGFNLNGNGIIVDSSDALTLSGIVSGTYGFKKTGASTLTLSGANTYHGLTDLTAGTIIVDTDTALGDGAVALASGTTLQFGTTTRNLTIANAITLAGAPTLDFGGSVPTSNDTTTGVFDASGSTVVLGGIISGPGVLTLANSGDVTLNGANTFDGGVTIDGSIVRIGNANALGSGQVNITAAGALRNDSGAALAIINDLDIAGGTIGGTSDLALAGIITGTATLHKVGADTLTIAGTTNSYSGAVNVHGGTLNVGGNLDGDVLVGSGATLAGTGSILGTVTVDGSISPGNSPGTLTVGNLILTAGSSLNFQLGTAGVVGGGVNDLIEVTNALTLNGTVNITALSGFGVGTYRLINYGGALTGSQADLTLGGYPLGFTPTNFVFDTSVTKQVNLMVLANAVQYWDGAGVTPNAVEGGNGNWTAAALNWTDASGTTNGAWASGSAVFTGTAGNVSVVDALAFDMLYFKTGGYVLGDGGGKLTGSATAEIKVDPTESATINAVLAGTHGILKTGDGTLVLGGANTFTGGVTVALGTLTVANSGALGSGLLDLAQDTDVIVNASFANDINMGGNSGYGATFSANGSVHLTGVISGTGAFIKVGSGEIQLSGTNTYTGKTFIDNGTLRITQAAAIGSGDIYILGNTALALAAADVTLTNNVILSGSAGIKPSSHVLTLTGVVSGAGPLVKYDSGTLVLTGVNTYAGGTSIVQGILSVASDDNLGGLGGISFDGSLGKALQLTADFNSARDIAFNDTGLIDGGSHAVVLSGIVSGIGELGKDGTGTLTLSGVNTYAGGTRINDGILSVSSDANLGEAHGNVRLGVGGGTSGTLQLTGDVTNSLRSIIVSAPGTIDTVGSSVGSFGGTVLGTGQLTKTGTGTLALSGNNLSFSGGIVVADGTLSLGSDHAAGSGKITTTGSIIDYVNGVTIGNGIDVNSNTTQLQVTVGLATQNGVIAELSGPRPLEKIGAGILVLGGNNSFTGVFKISGGTIGIADNNALGLGAVTLANDTALQARAAGFVVTNTIALTGVVGIDSAYGLTPSTGLTLTGAITGTGTLDKTGNGNLVLSGSNSYAGGTLLSGGSIAIATNANLGAAAGGVTFQSATTSALITTGSFTTSRDLITTNGNTALQIQSGSAVIWNGAISGTGELVKSGAGSLELTDLGNSYTNTLIKDGTLIVGGNAALGILAGTIGFAGTGNGTLALSGDIVTARGIVLATDGKIDTGAHTLTSNGVISGAGVLTKAGSGILALNGVSTYGGGTNLSGGTIEVSDDLALGAGTLAMANGTTLKGVSFVELANAITLSGNNTFDSSVTTMFLDGIISGTGRFIKTGADAIGLTVDNSYSGGTFLNAGSLTVYTSAGFGSGTLTTANNTSLGLTGAAIDIANHVTLNGALAVDMDGGAATLSGIIDGAGSLDVGDGTLTLGGQNTYQGGTTIAAANVLVTNSKSLGAGPLALTGNAGLHNNSAGAVTLATLISLTGTNDSIGGSGNLTLDGVISGTGGFTKDGSGKLTLTGIETYAGNTSVAAGTLNVNGHLTGAGTVSVVSGATLGGSGSIDGAVTVASGGAINPGNSPGTITFGSLALSSGALLNFDLGETSVVGGAHNDLIIVTHDLSLNGLLNVTDSGSFSLGVYRLINYGGNLTGNGLTINSLPGAFTGQIQTAINGQVNLLVASPGTLPLFWDGGDTVGNGTIDGGAGTWSATGSNWTAAPPSGINTNWIPGGVGTFAGAAGGIVNIVSPISFQVLQFTTTGYVLNATAGNGLAMGTTGAISTDAGVTTTISAPLSGGALSKQGGGTLILSGNNSYTGGTAITAGTLAAGSNTAFGTGAVTISNLATLQAAASVTLANATALVGDATVDTQGFTLTLGGIISGGTLVKNGSGSLVLNGANTYAATSLTNGTIYAGTNTALGVGALTMSGGTQLAAGVSGLVVSNLVNISGTSRIDSGASSFALSGVISGTGLLAKQGGGTLILSGTNTYSGGTNLADGTIQVVNNAALGTGTLTFTGGTTLQAGGGITLANAIVTAGSDTIDSQLYTLTLAGPVSGGGSLVKTGFGTLTLNGINSYAGGTSLTEGRIAVGKSSALGTGTLTFFNGTALAAGANNLTLANAITTAGLDVVDTGSFNLTLGGVIGGTGVIEKTGNGTLILNGINSYSGGTNLTSGTLVVGTSLALGTGTLNMTGGSTLKAGAAGLALANAINTVNVAHVDTAGFTLALHGIIAGAGQINKDGLGTLILDGANTYEGGTVLQTGTLQVGSNAALGTGTLVMLDGTTFAAGAAGLAIGNTIHLLAPAVTGNVTLDTRAYDLTLGGQVHGTGVVTKTGSGNLILNGNNAYTDGTILTDGTITVGTDTALGDGTLAMSDLTTLRAGVTGLVLANAITTAGTATVDTQAFGLALGGDITGLGGIDKIGSGTLTLTGASTYTGATAVTDGTLRVNGSLGLTSVSVVSGATLAGHGSIAGAVDIADGGILAAGGSPGVLTVGSLTLHNDSILDFDLGAANTIAGPSNDLVVVNGNLILDGQLNVTDSAAFGLGFYELFGYTGTLTDNGLSIASLPGAGTGIVQTLVPGQVNLIVAGPGQLIQYWDGADGIGNGIRSGGAGTWSTLGTNWTGEAPSEINASWQGAIGIFQGTAGTVTIDSPQSFQMLQFATDGYNLVGSGTGGLVTGGIGVIAGMTGTTTNISAPITGSGSIAKQGGGTLNLSGASSYTGGTDLQFGTLGVGSNTALGTGTLTIQNGAILAAAADGLVIANAVTTIAGGNVDSGAGTFTLAGVIGGAGSIIKAGSGNLVLNGANGFTGLDIHAGTVTLGTNTAAGIGNIALANGTTLAPGVDGLVLANTLTTAGIGTIATGASTLTLAGVIGGLGSITKTGSGNLVLNGVNAFTNLALAAGSVTLGTNTAAGIGGIALAGGTRLAAGVTGLVVTNAVTTAGIGQMDSGTGLLTLSGNISGAGSISKIGTGTLFLSGANSFASAAINAGTLAVGSAGALGTGGLAINTGTTLQAGITGLGFANAFTLTGATTIDTQAFTLTASGIVGGAGSLAKIGSGTLTLTGANTYSGGTLLNVGTIAVGSTAALGTDVLTFNGGALQAATTGLTIANVIAVTGTGTVDTQANALTLSGATSGAGALTKTGSGTLFLTGTSTRTGLTTITAGTLSGTVASLGSGNIVDNAALVFNQAVNASYGPTISGTGTVTKAGAGNLTLTGSSSVSGGTSITGGTLTVTGALTASTVTVGTGTTLAGTGSIAGLVATSGSTVSPGVGDGVVGTLTVSKAATFQAGSTLLINVTPTIADRITIGGAATLAGNLTLTAGAGQYLFNTSYTLLSATGGRTGTFTAPALTLFGSAFAPTLTYGGTDLVLKLVPNSLVTLLGAGPYGSNILNTAAAFDRATSTTFNPQAFYNLYLQGAGMGAAINQLTGEIHSAESRQAMVDTRHIREAAFDRLGADVGGSKSTHGGRDAADATSGGSGTAVWGRAIGSWGKTDSDGNGAKLDIDTKGILVGADTGTEGFKVGALFNYLESKVDTAILGTSKVKSTGGALYAGYRADHGFAVAVGGAAAIVKARSNRSITIPGLAQTLVAHTSGTSYQLFGDVSYDLAAATNTRVEPFARFAFVGYDVGAFTENGGFAAVSANRSKYDTTFATVGLRASTLLGASTSLRGSAGYQRTGGDRAPVAGLSIQGTGQFADVRSVALDKSAFVGEAGVDVRLAKNASLGVGYSGVIGKNNSDNGVKATLTIGF